MEGSIEMNTIHVSVLPMALSLVAAGCGVRAAQTRAPDRAISNRENIVPADTRLKIRTTRPIPMWAVFPGQWIEAEVAEAVEVGGHVKVPAGATAILSVVDARSGSPPGAARLVLLKLTQLRRSVSDRVEVSTAGLERGGTEIAAGSVLTFRLESPAFLE